MTSVQVSHDLQAQTAGFLHDHFQDSINEDDLKLLTGWISNKLEEERQGWKKKIQMSFKEVEKERKLGLSTQSSIQRIIGLFDPYCEPLYLYREPSVYHSAEEDTRVGNVEQLEKNIQAVLRMLDNHQEERIECLHYLNITDQDVHLADAMRKRITKLEQQLGRTETEWKETEQRLLKEIQTANSALDMQTQLANDQKDKTSKEMAEMRKLLTELETKMKNVPSFLSLKGVHKGTQVNLVNRKPTRDCCIQVSLDLTGDTGLQRKKNLSKEQDDKTDGKQIDIMDIYPPSDSGSLHNGISSITIVKQRENKATNIRNHIGKSRSEREKTPTMHTRGEAIMATTTQSSSFSDFGKDVDKKIEKYEDNESHQHTVTLLRNHVVSFAKKLESSRHQMNQYHEHMTLKKSRENGHLQNKDPDTARSNYTSRSIYDFRHDQLKGFLSGVKVKDGTQSARDHKQPIKSDSQKPIKGMLSYSGTAKCLRCNKLYKTKENTDSSCTFHSKSKIKFEKYDSGGKLQRVVQLWQCCMQSSEHLGCHTGQHI